MIIIIRWNAKYIFVINLFEDTDVANIFYKPNQEVLHQIGFTKLFSMEYLLVVRLLEFIYVNIF